MLDAPLIFNNKQNQIIVSLFYTGEQNRSSSFEVRKVRGQEGQRSGKSEVRKVTGQEGQGHILEMSQHSSINTFWMFLYRVPSHT